MCRIYNEVGCVTEIMRRLHKQGIWDFNSLDEILMFERGYKEKKQQIFLEHQASIEKEKADLESRLDQLNQDILASRKAFEDDLRMSIRFLQEEKDKLGDRDKHHFLLKIYTRIKVHRLDGRIKQCVSRLVSETPDTVKYNIHQLEIKSQRHQYLTSHFNKAISDSASGALRELDRRHIAIEQLKSFIAGAYGELEVVRIVRGFSNDVTLINDFQASFFKALYYSNENTYIKTIQADHVVVSPAGVFVIETKNWSAHSMNNSDLFSPIQQIKRAAFAIFTILNEGMATGGLRIRRHHWGERKIPIRNIIVLTKTKPQEEFQYAKILLPSELAGYISYFKPVFSIQESAEIAQYLFNYSNKIRNQY